MTAPDQSNPDGSLAPGLFAQRQQMTEDDAKGQMRSSGLMPWTRAQENMQAYIAGVGREVTRLDNRIDELIIGNELVHVATFSESGVWSKPPGASRLVIAVLSGSSGGGRGNNSAGSADFARGGLGGYSGGWSRGQINAADVPDNVAVVVGAGSAGATTSGAAAAAGESRFGDLIVSTGATGTNYGTGDYSFQIRGGDGGYPNGSRLMGWSYTTAAYGGAGSFSPGGEGGAQAGSGNHGNNDYSVTEVGKVGMGSGGGGGAANSGGSAGGRGGDGGWPSGSGGGGGGSNLGASGNGGNGAGGMVVVMTYREDSLGVAPTAPTGLAASNITSTGATLTWNASTDDIGVRRYSIFINGIQAGVSDNTTYTLTGLNPVTTYSITVRAVDLGGNTSDDSATLSLITTA